MQSLAETRASAIFQGIRIMKITVTNTMEVPLDIELMAQVFCELDDYTQAQFFVHVAREMERVCNQERAKGSLCLGPDHQWYAIGRQMATCPCVTDAARDMIDEIHRSLHQDEDES